MNNNPWNLPVILLMLLLNSDKQIDAKLGYTRGMLAQTARSLQTMREGIETLSFSFSTMGAVLAQPDQDSEDTTTM